MDEISRIARQFTSEASRHQFAAAWQGAQVLRVAPTNAYPVDRLLKQSQLQKMKRLLELADSRRQAKAKRHVQKASLSIVPESVRAT